MAGIRGWWFVSAVVAAVALSAMPAPALAAGTYAWTLTCKASGIGGGYASVGWNWTLDGAPISGANGTALCPGTGTVSGVGARPANANGFSATLTVVAEYSNYGLWENSNTVSKSFNPTKGFGTQVKASAGGGVWICNRYAMTCYKLGEVHEDGTFSVNS